MSINFHIPQAVLDEVAEAEEIARKYLRPYGRELDEREHCLNWEYINFAWPRERERQKAALERLRRGEPYHDETSGTLRLVLVEEMLSWGDAGGGPPGAGLGGWAIEAIGTPEQTLRLLARYAEGDQPVWGAMAMTEPGAGSDTASIQTSAVFDADAQEWILNGEKIFCSNGKLALEESNGLVIVWATVDRKAGRAGMKPFVVEAGTPGVYITKLEIKHGLRAGFTTALSFQNARIPAGNILGDEDVQTGSGAGFQRAMKVFDSTRPLAAAFALGMARAALDFLKEVLAEQGIAIPYHLPSHRLTAIQRDVLEMDAQYRATLLLTLRAAVMVDEGQRNSQEAAMCKVKAGAEMHRIAQKAVEILGMMGYSREWLVEKWMRDSRINDIHEGTGQINRLIVARHLLGYGRKELV